MEESEDVGLTDAQRSGTVEKILMIRSLEDGGNQQYEYLVKWQGFAYVHCSWEFEETAASGERGAQRLQRFRRKWEEEWGVNPEGWPTDEEEVLNPEWLVVDRIFDAHYDEASGATYYWTKWRDLPYTEASCESIEVIGDQTKVDEFLARQEFPKPEKQKTGYVELKKSLVYKNDNMLRSYQLEGHNWLMFSWTENRNTILADEMGLGKTAQTVSVIDRICTDYRVRGPFLVVSPLSALPHWAREFEQWTNLNVIYFHGNQKNRDLIFSYEIFYTDRNKKLLKHGNEVVYKFHVLLTTPEMILQEAKPNQPSQLLKIDWKYVVVDEAHRLKNDDSKLMEVMRRMKVKHWLLLSGTPLQNNTAELWSLLNLLDPKIWGKKHEFLEKYGDVVDHHQVTALRAALKPYMLRRMKDDVETLLPKEETVINVELTGTQKKYYKAVYERNIEVLRRASRANNAPSLMNVVMELRKCCNHPYLLRGVEESESHGSDATMEMLISTSGKMVLLDKLLPKLRADNHKVLIFSQMVRMLDILVDFLKYRGYSYERLDGRIRGSERQRAIDNFCRSGSDRFVFLASTRAGGQGINLTAANTVIIYDSDWNPQNDVQAQARCHRIGQTQQVKVYRLITRNTYEAEMFDRASRKLGLDKAVLQRMGAGENRAEAAKQIDSWLRHGAYALFDEQEDAAAAFCEEDIDQILSKRAQTVVEEGRTGGEFAKASFVAAGSEQLSMEDPDFWTKTGIKNVEEEVELKPRIRMKVKRLGMDNLSSDDDDEAAGVVSQPIVNAKVASAPSGSSDRSGVKIVKERKGRPQILWPKTDRRAFRKSFLKWGVGRWDNIQAEMERALGKERAIEEVEAYGVGFVFQCARFFDCEGPSHENSICLQLLRRVLKPAGDPSWNDQLPLGYLGVDNGPEFDVQMGKRTQQLLTELLASVTRELAPRLDQSLKSEAMIERCKRESRKLVLQFALADRLRRAVAACKDPLTEVPVPDNMTMIQTPWWGSKEDRHLLCGVYKYGHPSSESAADYWDKIRLDPDFMFSKVEFLNTSGSTSDEDSGSERKCVAAGEDRMDVVESGSGAAAVATTVPVKEEEATEKPTKQTLPLIGEEFEMYWDQDKKWYKAVVENIDGPRYSLYYPADGSQETIDFSQETDLVWRSLKKKAPRRRQPSLKIYLKTGDFRVETHIPRDSNLPSLTIPPPPKKERKPKKAVGADKGGVEKPARPSKPKPQPLPVIDLEFPISSAPESGDYDWLRCCACHQWRRVNGVDTAIADTWECVMSGWDCNSGDAEEEFYGRWKGITGKSAKRGKEWMFQLDKRSVTCFDLYGASRALGGYEVVTGGLRWAEVARQILRKKYAHDLSKTATSASNAMRSSYIRFALLEMEAQDGLPPPPETLLLANRFGLEKPAPKEDVEEVVYEKKWPSHHVLRQRYVRLLDGVWEERQRLKNMKEIAKKEEQRRRALERKLKDDMKEDVEVTGWTKAERWSVISYIFNHGVAVGRNSQFDYHRMHSHIGLPFKSVERFVDFCGSLIGFCKQVVAGVAAADDEDGGNILTGEIEVDDGATETGSEWGITAGTAAQLLHRIQLSTVVRLRVVNATEMAHVHLTVCGAAPSIPWWTPNHDMALLRGVGAFGFDFTRIAAEHPDLFSLAGGAKRAANGDCRVVLSDPNVCMRRLEQLVRHLSKLCMNRSFNWSAAEAMASSFMAGVEDYVPTEIVPARYIPPTESSKPKDVPGDADSSAPKRMRSESVESVAIPGVSLPLFVGDVQLIRTGEVVYDRSAYHTERYLYPVGFCSKRLYFSPTNTEQKVQYTSEILDGGSAPIFRVSCDSRLDVVAEGSTPSAAWTALTRKVAGMRSIRSRLTSVSGPEYFGLCQPQVVQILARLPNVELCTRFKLADATGSNNVATVATVKPPLVQAKAVVEGSGDPMVTGGGGVDELEWI